MHKNEEQDVIVFQIQELLKTSRPGVSLPNIVLRKFDKHGIVLNVAVSLDLCVLAV
jgi:hypothetical protein